MKLSVYMEGGCVRVVFEDDGVGMSEEFLKNIFEPFFSTKYGQGATGLGMTIVKDLVEKSLRGWLWVASEKVKGTKVNMVLPLSLAPWDKKPSSVDETKKIGSSPF